MKISIASYSFHGLLEEGKMDLFGYLESCKYRYHLQSADIWNGMLVSTDDDYLAKVKDALDERELVLANLCVDDAHIWEDNPAAREKNYKNALAHLHAAEVLGAKTIRIDAGVEANNFTNEQFDWIIKRYKEYAQRAHDNGYRVGPENHWGAEEIPQNMKRICETVDHPAFGVLLHFKGPLADHKMMVPWAMHTHVTWEFTGSELAERMTLLRDAGYQGYWGIEYHTGQTEYVKSSVLLARVSDVLADWRLQG